MKIFKFALPIILAMLVFGYLPSVGYCAAHFTPQDQEYVDKYIAGLKLDNSEKIQPLAYSEGMKKDMVSYIKFFNELQDAKTLLNNQQMGLIIYKPKNQKDLEGLAAKNKRIHDSVDIVKQYVNAYEAPAEFTPELKELVQEFKAQKIAQLDAFTKQSDALTNYIIAKKNHQKDSLDGYQEAAKQALIDYLLAEYHSIAIDKKISEIMSNQGPYVKKNVEDDINALKHQKDMFNPMVNGFLGIMDL